MINYDKTNMVFATERQVQTVEIPLISSGMALVGVLEGGIGKVRRSTGATTDQFVGIAMAPKRSFDLNTRIDQVVVPATAPYVVLLTRTATGSIGAYNNTTGVEITVSNAIASAINIQNGTDATTGLTNLTFDVSLAGQTFNIAYAYIPSTIEDTALWGNPYPGAAPSDVLGQTGVFRIGRIGVNNFDPLANWYSGVNFPGVKIIAGGKFTDSGNAATGVIPTNVDIVEVPTSASPWLVLEIR